MASFSGRIILLGFSGSVPEPTPFIHSGMGSEPFFGGASSPSRSSMFWIRRGSLSQAIKRTSPPAIRRKPVQEAMKQPLPFWTR